MPDLSGVSWPVVNAGLSLTTLSPPGEEPGQDTICLHTGTFGVAVTSVPAFVTDNILFRGSRRSVSRYLVESGDGQEAPDLGYRRNDIAICGMADYASAEAGIAKCQAAVTPWQTCDRTTARSAGDAALRSVRRNRDINEASWWSGES